MKRLLAATLGFLISSFPARADEPKADFSTPEGAVLMIEAAYRAKDLEAAVAAKDFMVEARVMLTEMGKGLEKDAEILKQTAEVLELSFRAEIQKKGFPDFTGVKSRFVAKEKFKRYSDIFAVTEVCDYPDGGASKQKLLVAKTPNGWRVLNPEE